MKRHKNEEHRHRIRELSTQQPTIVFRLQPDPSSPFTQVVVSFLEVLQFFQSVYLLLDEPSLRLPRVVDVGPVLPLDLILRLSLGRF